MIRAHPSQPDRRNSKIPPVRESERTAGEHPVDKDRIAGSIKEIKGNAKVAVGKAVGDAKLQSDGKVDIAIGKAQNAVGGASDAIRDASKVK
jgi:uncharacterized protein YjbJ (UPF0337 family)